MLDGKLEGGKLEYFRGKTETSNAENSCSNAQSRINGQHGNITSFKFSTILFELFASK